MVQKKQPKMTNSVSKNSAVEVKPSFILTYTKESSAKPKRELSPVYFPALSPKITKSMASSASRVYSAKARTNEKVDKPTIMKKKNDGSRSIYI